MTQLLTRYDIADHWSINGSLLESVECAETSIPQTLQGNVCGQSDSSTCNKVESVLGRAHHQQVMPYTCHFGGLVLTRYVLWGFVPVAGIVVLYWSRPQVHKLGRHQHKQCMRFICFTRIPQPLPEKRCCWCGFRNPLLDRAPQWQSQYIPAFCRNAEPP